MPQIRSKQVLGEYPVNPNDLSNKEYVDDSIIAISGTTVIGPAEDGTYTDGIFTDFTDSTRVGVAVDRFNEMLLLLAPTPPVDNWDNVFSNLNITSTEYSARALTSGSVVNNITSDTTPSYTLTDIVGTGANSRSTNTATFTMLDEGGTLETDTITPASTSKTTGIIQYTIADPYFGESGKAGFWTGVTSFDVTGTIGSAITPSANQRTLTFTHPGSDSPELYNYYINNPVTSSVGTVTATVPSMTGYISGVPSLNTGDSITNIDFIISNGVSYFYAPTYVWDIIVATVDAQIGDPDSIPTTPGQTMVVTGAATTVRDNRFSDTSFSFSVRGRNAVGSFSSQSVFASSLHRVDTVSNESSRLTSGSGNYPSSGYGGVYDSTQSLVGTYTDEMMLKNGTYQYPNGNYTTFGGSDYSSISNTRWSTFNLGTFTNNSAFALNFIGSSGISTIGQANLLVEIKIEGATFWVDGDANYSGVGNPGSVSNGVAAVVSGSSTPTARRITFGAISYSGNIIVRIGFTGSGPTFTSLTATNLV
jgi:hypothetical protein